MKICNFLFFSFLSLSLSGFFRPLFFLLLLAPLCNVFKTSSFQAPPPGGLRVVHNSDRWEYGMGLAYTSLPLWLSATLQGAGREGRKTKKKLWVQGF